MNEKIIEGLQSAWNYIDVQKRTYQSAFTSTAKIVAFDDTLQALKMAIDLIKKQEPKVFNVGDFFGEEFGYLEYRTDTPGFSNFEPSPVFISDIDEESVTVIFRSASVLKLPLDTMNKNWRIWSDYPTHELLKEVKWE